jgi:phosphate butyryltransferase
MSLQTLQSLVDRARSKGVSKLAIAVAQDDDVLEAVRHAQQDGFIQAILIGDEKLISISAKTAGLDGRSIEIIHEPDPAAACRLAVQSIRSGKASLLMKGLVTTSILMKAVLNKENGIAKAGLLSHVALFESPYYHKIFGLTDAAVNIKPDLQDKISIIKNAVDIFHRLGISQPKTGILAAVESVNPKIEATVHAAELKEMNRKDLITGCIIDGPFALDNAVSIEAARHKGITSGVAGEIDLLLAPDINSGNILYKSLNFLGGAITAAVVAGSMAPIVLTSRSDSAKNKYLSIALAAAL